MRRVKTPDRAQGDGRGRKNIVDSTDRHREWTVERTNEETQYGQIRTRDGRVDPVLKELPC